MFYQSPFAHRPIANVGGLFEENQSFHCTLSITASAISKSNKLNLTMRKHTTNLVIDQALLNSTSSNELASCWRSNPLLNTQWSQFIDLSRPQRHTNKVFDWSTNYRIPRIGAFPVFIVVFASTLLRPFYERSGNENNTYQIFLCEKSLVHVMRVYFDRSAA